MLWTGKSHITLDQISFQLKNNGPVDWQGMAGRIMNATELIDLLVTRKVTIELLGPWAEDEFWLNILAALNAQSNDYSA